MSPTRSLFLIAIIIVVFSLLYSLIIGSIASWFGLSLLLVILFLYMDQEVLRLPKVLNNGFWKSFIHSYFHYFFFIFIGIMIAFILSVFMSLGCQFAFIIFDFLSDIYPKIKWLFELRIYLIILLLLIPISLCHPKIRLISKYNRLITYLKQLAIVLIIISSFSIVYSSSVTNLGRTIRAKLILQINDLKKQEIIYLSQVESLKSWSMRMNKLRTDDYVVKRDEYLKIIKSFSREKQVFYDEILIESLKFSRPEKSIIEIRTENSSGAKISVLTKEIKTAKIETEKAHEIKDATFGMLSHITEQICQVQNFELLGTFVNQVFDATLEGILNEFDKISAWNRVRSVRIIQKNNQTEHLNGQDQDLFNIAKLMNKLAPSPIQKKQLRRYSDIVRLREEVSNRYSRITVRKSLDESDIDFLKDIFSNDLLNLFPQEVSIHEIYSLEKVIEYAQKNGLREINGIDISDKKWQFQFYTEPNSFLENISHEASEKARVKNLTTEEICNGKTPIRETNLPPRDGMKIPKGEFKGRMNSNKS